MWVSKRLEAIAELFLAAMPESFSNSADHPLEQSTQWLITKCQGDWRDVADLILSTAKQNAALPFIF